jgi:hypothetical protein
VCSVTGSAVRSCSTASRMPSCHTSDPTLCSPAPGGGSASMRRRRNSASSRVQPCTSSQSWSSASIQKTGHGTHVVVAPDALGEADGRDRLEQREERAAEEAGLLTGDDRDGAGVGQGAGGGEGVRRGLAALELRSQDTGECRPLARLVAGGRDRRRPRRGLRGVAVEEPRQLPEVEHVVDRETPRPRQSPEVDGEPQGTVRRDGVRVHESRTLAKRSSSCQGMGRDALAPWPGRMLRSADSPPRSTTPVT